MAIRRYLIDLETKSIDLTQNEIKNAVVHNLDSASRPASPLEGQLMFNTDSKLLELWNGSAWLPIPNQLTGQLTFADYGSGTYTGTVSTIAGFDSSGNLIELNGSNFIIPGLTTGIEEGIIGYDANNKLIKSLLIKIYGQDLSYGFGYGAADNNIGLDVMAVGTDAANYNIGNLVNAFGPSAAFNNQGSIVNAFGMGAGYGNIFNNVHIFSHYGGVADNHNQVVLGDATITKTKLFGTLINPSYGTGTTTGTVSTLAAFDLAGNLIEIDGSNFTLPNLGTGDEVGIVAYDANNKLIKSSFLQKDGARLKVEGYGIGNNLGSESTFPAFDSSGKLIESQLITTNGTNVGIGDTDPTQKLDVGGNVKASGFYLKDTADTELRALIFSNNEGDGVLRLYNGLNTGLIATGFSTQPRLGSSNTGRLTIRGFGNSTGIANANDVDLTVFDFLNRRVTIGSTAINVDLHTFGKIGIGTSNPLFTLDIHSDNPVIRLNDLTSGDQHFLTGNNGEFRVQTTGFLSFRTNNTPVMTILQNGNVGIGTAGAAQKLHLDGGIARFSNTASNWLDIDANYNNANNVGIISRFNGIFINAQSGAGAPFIALQTGSTTRLGIDSVGKVTFDAYGTGTITGTESTFPTFDNSGKLLESNILKIGAAPDGGGAIGINTTPDWPLHIKGGVFNMALIESTSNTARLLFKTSTSTIFPLIEVIGDNMLLDAPKVTVKNTHLDSPTSGGDSRILGIDVNNKIILSDGIRITPNLSGLPTLDLRNVDTYVTNTLAGFDGTKIVNNPHIQIAQGGGFTNVGIGGTPQFPLHVFGDTRNNAMFVEGQNNETRLAIRDLSGGNIYMASRFGVMKLFSNSNIQLWAGGTNKATVNANGTLTLSIYGLGNNIGSEATFPVFDSTGVIRESRLITTDGSALTFVNGTRKTRILDGEIGFERLNGGGYPAYVRVNRVNGNFLEINARSRVDITTNTVNIQAIFAESQNGFGHQFPYYGQGNLQSGTDAYITAFSSTGVIKESSAIKLLGNATALAIGHNVPYNSQSFYTILGHSALLNSSNAGNFLTVLGASTGTAVTGLFINSTVVGNAAVFLTANNVNNSVVIGEQAGQRSGYTSSVIIGYRAGYFASGDRQFSNVIAIGDEVVPEKNNQIVIGKTSSTEFKTFGQIVNPTYGLGNVSGTESTFPAFDANGKLIESQLITTNGSDVTIGKTPTSFIKTNDSGGTVFGYGSSQLINGGALVWKDGATERFRITAGGNVGIGTSSPIAKLDVRGAIYILNGNELSWHNGFGTLTGGIYSDGGGALDFFTRDGSNRDRKLRIRGNGQLLLDKYGTGAITGTESTFPAFTASGDIVESQLITTNGTNIGIGKANPVHKLDINGVTNTKGLYSSSVNLGFETQIAAIGTSGAYNAGYYFGSSNTSFAARIGMAVGSGDVFISAGTTSLLRTVVDFKANGTARFRDYGTGAITGTESTFAAFQSDGKLIESQLITTDGSNIIVNGNLNITEGNAYLYDGVQALRLSKGTDTIYTNTIGGYLAGSPSSTRQTVFGNATGQGNTGANQSAFGYFAGYLNTGADQSAFGFQAGLLNTAGNQSAFGFRAGRENTGVNQAAFGGQAGLLNTGVNQSAFGYAAGQENTGASQSVFGVSAGRDNTGNNQSAFGNDAGRLNTGANQSAFGYLAGRENTGANQSAFGYQAGYLNEGDNTVLIGYQAGQGNIIDNIFILKQNNVNTTSLIEGDFLSGKVGFRNYGTGTITGSFTRILGVEADGDVVEVTVNDILRSVPSYADNASALTGGLAIGDTYYNNLLNTYTRVP